MATIVRIDLPHDNIEEHTEDLMFNLNNFLMNEETFQIGKFYFMASDVDLDDGHITIWYRQMYNGMITIPDLKKLLVYLENISYDYMDKSGFLYLKATKVYQYIESQVDLAQII